MIQINNGFKEYYYLTEEGTVFDSSSGKYIKADKKHLFNLVTEDNSKKKVSLKNLYKDLYGKNYCIDNIESLDGEEWRECKYTEGTYQVSNYGRVKSYQRYEAKIINPYKTKDGYYRLDLHFKGDRYSVLLHRLVAGEWLEWPDNINYYELHHKDFDTTNNRADNLEWLSVTKHRRLHAEKRKKVGKKNETDKSTKSEKDNHSQKDM